MCTFKLGVIFNMLVTSCVLLNEEFHHITSGQQLKLLCFAVVKIFMTKVQAVAVSSLWQRFGSHYS